MGTEFRVILLQLLLLSDFSITDDSLSLKMETIPPELSSPVSEKRSIPSEPVEYQDGQDDQDDQDDDFFYGCFLKKQTREEKAYCLPLIFHITTSFIQSATYCTLPLVKPASEIRPVRSM